MAILAGARVLTPRSVLDPGWIEVAGGTITAVGSGEPPAAPDHALAGGWVVPGFVDLHVHGGGGASYGGDADAVRAAAAFHRRHGTTTTLASLVTAPMDELVRQVGILTELTEEGLIAGIHLEGPFLSRARCGAHDPSLLRDPRAEDVRRLLDAGRGAVRMVTVAPELDGGLEAVRSIAGDGCVAAVGHTDASHETARAAVDAGARVATHLFNAMPPMRHRDPGPVGALLSDPRVTVEVINDGLHLHPDVVRTAAAAAAGGAALVTDAMLAAGMGDGDFQLGSMAVAVRGGAARLAEGGGLAGSTLTMAEAFRRAALALGAEAAAEMASAAPARVLDRGDIGALEAGRRADLVATDEAFLVRGVMAGGAWVDRDGA